MAESMEDHQLVHQVPSPSIFDRFWQGKGSEFSEIIGVMSQKEPWVLDRDLGMRLEAFAEAISEEAGFQLDGLAEQHDFVQLQAWLSSEKALMFASLLDDTNPRLITDILEMAGNRGPSGDALALFVERIATFSRARLLSDLFSVDRVRRIEKLTRKVKL